ncbi:DUF2142 domain-containing protein [Patescibacteria group bacterium]|nr:DUF2142 domain-containing protein [Patescibacteria group bacterium]
MLKIKNNWLIILLLLTLVKGIFWSLLTPIFQAPDENVHFGIIQYIGENNHHPGPKNGEIVSKELVEVGSIVRFNWMSSHPVWQGTESDWLNQINQLDLNLKTNFGSYQRQGGQKLPQAYYWLNWPVYKIFQNQSFLIRFYSLRIVSVLLGVATVYISYLIGLLIFKSRSLGLATASLVAFQPMASVIFSSITYDSLAIFTATLFLYFSIIFIKNKQTKYLWLTLLVSLFALTVKTQLITLLLSWPFLLTKKHFKKLAIFTPLIVVVGFIKDYKEMLTRTFSWLNSGSIFSNLTQYLTQNSPRMWAEIFPWYWGVFGWLEAVMPMWVYAIIKLITLISLIGLVYYLFKHFKAKSKQYLITKFLIIFTLLISSVIFVNDFIIFTGRSTVFGVQGRYLLPAITSNMALLVLGIISLLPVSLHRLAGRSIIFFSLCLNIVGIYSLIKYFGCQFCLY